MPIAEMTPDAIRERLRALHRRGRRGRRRHHQPVRSLPTIWSGLLEGLEDLRGRRRGDAASLPRTDQDLSMKFVLGGILALIAAIMLAPPLHMNLLGALLIVVFGFLFVTVSSRLTGEIGSSSNPISGMTVATLLLTCLVFLLVGWTGPDLLRHGALGRRDRLHRRVERRHDLAGSEDRLPGRRHAAQPADRDPHRRARLGAGARSDPAAA